jgi:plasmid maintenance system antidote protein VapI
MKEAQMASRFHSPDEIIDVLRERLASRGAQTEFAEASGVSKSYLSELIAGKKVAPGDAVLRGLGFDPTPHYRRLRRSQ